jgi:hypothetical protein
MYFENRELSTIGLEWSFSLIRTKPCNPCTRRVHNVYTAYTLNKGNPCPRRVHNVYTAYTLNKGRTNDYRLACRATLLSCGLEWTIEAEI